MGTKDKLSQFEKLIMPHLDAAYNLARWLTRNDADAEDVVQEAYLRAFRFFGGFHGEDARRWLLAVVRNTCYTWLQKNRAHELTTLPDDEMDMIESRSDNPETEFLRATERHALQQAIEALPFEFREAIVLRELEGLSYKEIATVINAPVGTVMSRLSRARRQLQKSLMKEVAANAL